MRVVRLDDLERIRVAGVEWRPIRRALGISAFGINAYAAGAGEQLIEEHDEAGGHEEVYLVVRGRAAFTVDGEEIDAPAGTLVFLPEPATRRSAVAVEDGTVAVAVGGSPGAAGPPSAWEHYFAAAPAVEAGDFERAYEIAAAGLADHASSGALHFNLACFKARAGDREGAFEHLERALALEPRARIWTAEDADLDTIRDDPRFPR